MKELALHILDIAQNSIAAGASQITIEIKEELKKDILEIIIKDNGSGMGKEVLRKALDPFYTSRTTRKVGLGLSLFQTAAVQCEGNLVIDSEEGKGTTVKVYFKHSHIDRVPIGNMTDTLITLIQANALIDYVYTHEYNSKKFYFNTVEVKDVLKEVEITDLHVLSWLREYIEAELKELVK